MTAIVVTRSYLEGQRRLIIARALAASIAGLMPVPFLDDWAIEAVLGGGYRRVAAAHGVDVDDTALANLVHGKTPPPSLMDMAAGGIAHRLAGIAAKRMMIALATVNRARASARTFVTMTLFDHYCARLHTGGPLDARTALALRDEIAGALAQTPGALSFHPFRRGALAAARATLKAPLELADLATGGAIRRLLTRKAQSAEVTDPEVVDDVERALEASLQTDTGFLARAVAAVEVHLSAEGNPYLDRAIEALDRRWRARVAAGIQ